MRISAKSQNNSDLCWINGAKNIRPGKNFNINLIDQKYLEKLHDNKVFIFVQTFSWIIFYHFLRSKIIIYSSHVWCSKIDMWFEHLTGKEGMCRPAAPKVALRSLHKIEFLASFWNIRILTVFLNKFFKTEVSTAKFKFQL